MKYIKIEDQETALVLSEHEFFTSRQPLRDHIVGALKVKPRILEHKTIAEQITEKGMWFVRTFDEGMGVRDFFQPVLFSPV